MGDAETSALLWELPASLFAGASVAEVQGSGFVAAQPSDAQPPPARGGEEARAAGRTDAWRERGFTSLEEWRAHTCSDLYRLNARRKSSGRAALTESEFSALVEAGDVSSISGGSSSSSSEGEGESEHGRRARGRSALDAKVVFSDARGGLFAVWRAALCSAREEKEESAWGRGTCAPARLRALRASTGLWLLVLARGGHFAAAVVRCSGPGGCSAPLLSRTFHRYVVRAKQGGRQGSKDATGKSIKSAGSALRRANEQALEREVRQLLGGEWRQQLTACELVWLAVSETDRRILLTGPEAPLQKEDERLRRVPFATRRPTLSEAKRVATQLAQVQLGVAPGSESEGDSEGEGEGGELSRPDPEPAAQEGPLHAAARSGDAVRVLQLLREGADPGARSARGCTPAALARDRPTRDAFRRARAEEGAEGRWDWDAAGVGAALSEEAVAAHAERRARAEQRRLAQQDQRRRQRAAEQEQQARAQAEREERDATALEQALSGARSKAGALLAGAREAERGAREARADAAERRLAQLGGLGGGAGGLSGGAGAAATPGPPPAAPPAVPWGSGSIAGGGGPGAAQQLSSPAPAPGLFGGACQPAFGDACDAALARLLPRLSAAQAAVLSRLLANAGGSPGEPKFRRLRLCNPKVADALVASGALAELLLPCFAWTLQEEQGLPEALAVQSDEAALLHAPAMLRTAVRLQAAADKST